MSETLPRPLLLRITLAQGLAMIDLKHDNTDLGRFLHSRRNLREFILTAGELRELLALLQPTRGRVIRNLRRKIVNVLIEAGETTL